MANKKGFVRYANNKLVAGSLILADKAPKVGVWKEVPADLCCENNIVCFTSISANLSNLWFFNGKWSETTIPPFGSNVQTFAFQDGFLGVATTLEEWVEIANQIYSWMEISFSINSEDPSKVDVCMKESLLKSMFPAENGSTFQFYIGAA